MAKIDDRMNSILENKIHSDLKNSWIKQKKKRKMLFDTGNRHHHGSLSVAYNTNRSPSSGSIYDNLAVTTSTKEANGDVSWVFYSRYKIIRKHLFNYLEELFI
jgi:hypothetical protein